MGNISPSVDGAEHIGPQQTGDNVEAKRVAGYVWDGSAWQRASGGLVPSAFDTIQITSYNANNDPLVVVYRTGGAAGTVVATLTITYDVAFNITEVVRT